MTSGGISGMPSLPKGLHDTGSCSPELAGTSHSISEEVLLLIGQVLLHTMTTAVPSNPAPSIDSTRPPPKLPETLATKCKDNDLSDNANAMIFGNSIVVSLLHN